MKSLNWFKINIFANIAAVVLYVLTLLSFILDPNSGLNTGLIDASTVLPPTPFYLVAIQASLSFLFCFSLALAIISLLVLIFKKIRKTTETSWIKISLAIIISIPSVLYCLSIIGELLYDQFRAV